MAQNSNVIAPFPTLLDTSGNAVMSQSASGPVMFGRTVSFAAATSGGFTPGNAATRFVTNNNASSTEASVSGLTPMVHFQAKDATGETFLIDSFGTNNALMLRRADGTLAAPTAIQNAETLGQIGGAGYGTSYTGLRAVVVFASREVWTGTNQGAGIDFYATATGSATAGKYASLDSTGLTMVAGTTVASPLFNTTSSSGGTTISTGVGSVRMATANPGTNTVWIPMQYQGGSYFVPGWTTNAP